MYHLNTKLFTILFTALFLSISNAQERIVKIDFESSSFYNNPKVPFDEPFSIMGETGEDVEYVKVNIYYEGKRHLLHSFDWNRVEQNYSESFNVVVPPILRSNTKYDFEIITYKMLDERQKDDLLINMRDRLRFLLLNNIYFDGKNVVVNNPKDVQYKIKKLIQESLTHYESKNNITVATPSSLVLEELNKQQEFRFSRFFKRTMSTERDEIANKLVDEKVEHLVNLISTELKTYMTSQLVMHYRMALVKSIQTDKEPFTLPINLGVYAWNKSANINNINVNNINFTLGAGVTIPFRSKSRIASRSRMFDSFGFSTGVLFQPIADANGVKFVTPGVNIPVYAALGFRFFKVLRFNAGVLVVGEQGNSGFNSLNLIPTAGLALELNMWMGIKK